jgi:hypothetical protein
MGLIIGAQTALLVYSLSENPRVLQDDTAEDEEGGRVEGWKGGRREEWEG